MKKRKYLSLYSIQRLYGGPEEGDWYYNQYTLMEFVKITNSSINLIEDAIKEYCNKYNSEQKSLCHSSEPVHYCYYIEDSLGEHENTKPNYE